MCSWAYVNDSEMICFFEMWEQEISQVKMSKMVDTHLHFQSIFSFSSLRNHHYTCVIDQKVNFCATILNKLSKLFDWIFITKIKNSIDSIHFWVDFSNFFDCLFEFSLISCTNNDITIFSSQIQNSLLSNTCITTSNNSDFSSKISLHFANSTSSIVF